MRLVNVILRGRLRSRAVVVTSAVIVLIALLAGWRIGANVGAGVLVHRARAAIVSAVALLGAISAIDRVCEDEKSGWLQPLVAAGLPRWRYGAAVVSVLVLEHVGLIALAFLAFGVAVAAGSLIAAPFPLRTIIGGAALVASVTVFGAVWGVLIRNRLGALAAAIAAFVSPWIFFIYWLRAHADPLPRIYARLIAAPVPHPTLAWSRVDDHLVLALVSSCIAVAAAQRWMARES